MDSQLKIDYELETKTAFTDSLTELFNHGFFQILLDKEFNRAERYGDSFTFGLIDINSFSSYNKKHGPVQGDRILREVARIIKDTVRQADSAARYAGDTFAVILTKADSTSAASVLERITRSVEATLHGSITISAGLASYPADAIHKESLIQKACKALQMAKIKGKNKVFFFKNEEVKLDDSLPRILVVDDSPLNLKMLKALLTPLNYEVIQADNGEMALHILKNIDVDLVLLDIMMPEMDGFEVCQRMKNLDSTRGTPIILVTALDDTNSKIRGIEAGADDFITKPPNKLELLARTKSLIKFKKLNDNLTSIENVLFSLANTVEAKDIYTQGHIERVANTAVAIGKKIGLCAKEIEALRIGGKLHDIGKIGVPESILNKQGPLNPEEWEIMKTHPDIGHTICLPLKKNIGLALDTIRHHHEKLDGSGYPDGLKGEEISVVARIMAIADIYDALTTNRPYRKQMPKEKAIRILCEEADDEKLDKEIIQYFIEMVGM